ncbi:MAG: DUF3800 domain-containing protein [Trueperaceae bacterium]
MDESGDIGLVNSPTRYFVLSGLVLHELRWQANLDQLINFRQKMKLLYGLKLREELHASHLINSPGELKRIKRNDRLSIIRALATELATMQDIQFINVVVDKQNKPAGYDVFEKAWQALIQRFENTLRNGNFPGQVKPQNDKGMLLPDRTDDKKLKLLLRKMRRYNSVPSRFSVASSRQMPLSHIIEDPLFKDSQDSYLTQCVDLSAYLLQQYLLPNAYMKKTGGYKYFIRLEPVLCKVASSGAYGIVRL